MGKRYSDFAIEFAKEMARLRKFKKLKKAEISPFSKDLILTFNNGEEKILKSPISGFGFSDDISNPIQAARMNFVGMVKNKVRY